LKISQTVAEILDQHVALEVECIDRMYLNLYVPSLQYVNGAVGFFRNHGKQAIASSALMAPISKKFVAAIESHIQNNTIPVVEFRKGHRKDDIAKQYLAEFNCEEGIVFIGKAQEKAAVFRTEKRWNPKTGQGSPWDRKCGTNLRPENLTLSLQLFLFKTP
jgi:hypothetical protein